jgi:glycosyl transferase family 1
MAGQTVKSPSFIVAQLGARMHYAVPSILAENGMLEHFYTDFSANRGWPKMLNLVPQNVRPRSLNRMLGRVARGVPPERNTAFNILGMRYAQRLRRCHSATERTSTFLWAGKQFCRQVMARGFGQANAIYTYNTAGLELLVAARRKGLLTVMEQTIAPKQIEVELLGAEHMAHPGWEFDGTSDRLAPDLIAREATEWDAAHLILCASEFVRDGIAKCGGPVERSVVVPYGVDVVGERSEVPGWASCGQKSEMGNRPLRVLTVGTVGLRKGSPYVLEAARQLKGRMEFRMVGGIGVTREVEEQLREHLELTGRVPPSELVEHFIWADLLLLPSLCEGSATVTYEALAFGLPVICTPNTGSVVRDGVEGFVVPIRDAAVIAERLRQFLDDFELIERMSANATERAKDFTVAKYGDRLTNALRLSFPN